MVFDAGRCGDYPELRDSGRSVETILPFIKYPLRLEHQVHTCFLQYVVFRHPTLQLVGYSTCTLASSHLADEVFPRDCIYVITGHKAR